MAYSYLEYTGDNSDTTFTSPAYLETSHLTVTVDGVTKTLGTDYTVSGTIVTFTTAPATDTKIKISRNSSQSARLTDYTDASLLTADAMDRDANQLFYVAQEAFDTAAQTSVVSATFYSSGSSAPASPSLGDLFFNTTSNILQVYSGGGWITVNGTEAKTVFTSPTSGERTFTTSANLGTDTMVFLNGVKLVEGGSNDYTISGASIVLTADDPTTSYVLEVINR